MSVDFPGETPPSLPLSGRTPIFGLSATGTAEVRTADGKLANNPPQVSKDE